MTGLWASGTPFDFPECPTQQHPLHHPTPLLTNDEARMWNLPAQPHVTPGHCEDLSSFDSGAARNLRATSARPALFLGARLQSKTSHSDARPRSYACHACDFAGQEFVHMPKRARVEFHRRLLNRPMVITMPWTRFWAL